jgi:DNA-binding transcriptional ArsR family regulator
MPVEDPAVGKHAPKARRRPDALVSEEKRWNELREKPRFSTELHTQSYLRGSAEATQESAAELSQEQVRNCLPYATPRLHINRVVTDEDRVFKALADASRRALLDRLRTSSGLTLNDLCQGHDMSRQAVTKHLALLEAADLVVTKWQGREKLHYLNPVPINEIYMRWIGKFERSRLRALHNLKQALEEDQHE